MTTSGAWRIFGSVTGLPSGTRAVDVSIAAPTTSVDVSSYTTFTTGFTAITVPTGATAVLIIPDPANTQTITAKGITGDTGIALNKVNPTVLALGTTPSLGLTVGGSVLIQLIFM